MLASLATALLLTQTPLLPIQTRPQINVLTRGTLTASGNLAISNGSSGRIYLLWDFSGSSWSPGASVVFSLGAANPQLYTPVSGDAVTAVSNSISAGSTASGEISISPLAVGTTYATWTVYGSSPSITNVTITITGDPAVGFGTSPTWPTGTFGFVDAGAIQAGTVTAGFVDAGTVEAACFTAPNGASCCGNGTDAGMVCTMPDGGTLQVVGSMAISGCQTLSSGCMVCPKAPGGMVITAQDGGAVLFQASPILSDAWEGPIYTYPSLANAGIPGPGFCVAPLADGGCETWFTALQADAGSFAGSGLLCTSAGLLAGHPASCVEFEATASGFDIIGAGYTGINDVAANNFCDPLLGLCWIMTSSPTFIADVQESSSQTNDFEVRGTNAAIPGVYVGGASAQLGSETNNVANFGFTGAEWLLENNFGADAGPNTGTAALVARSTTLANVSLAITAQGGGSVYLNSDGGVHANACGSSTVVASINDPASPSACLASTFSSNGTAILESNVGNKGSAADTIVRNDGSGRVVIAVDGGSGTDNYYYSPANTGSGLHVSYGSVASTTANEPVLTIVSFAGSTPPTFPIIEEIGSTSVAGGTATVNFPQAFNETGASSTVLCTCTENDNSLVSQDIACSQSTTQLLIKTGATTITVTWDCKGAL